MPEDPTGEDFLFGVGEGTAMMEYLPAPLSSKPPIECAADRL